MIVVSERRGARPPTFSFFFFFSSFVSVCDSVLFLSLVCFFLYKLTPFVPLVPHFLIPKLTLFTLLLLPQSRLCFLHQSLQTQTNLLQKVIFFEKFRGKDKGTPPLFLSLTHYPSSCCCAVFFSSLLSQTNVDMVF